MKIGLLLIFFALPIFPQLWYDNTEGVNVEAMGRGGAGIAIAANPAGVWHNPAGLAQIAKAQVSFAAEHIATEEKYHELQETHWVFTGDDFIERYETLDDRSDGHWSGLGYISALKPVIIGGKQLALQAGYRRLASFPDAKGSWIQLREFEDPDGTITDHWEHPSDWKTDSHGGIDDWGMAGAMKMAHWLSLGINLHFMNADYGFDGISDPRQGYSSSYRIYRDYAFSGLLWDLGVHIQVLPSVGVGAVYRSGLDAGLDYQWTFFKPASADLEADAVKDHTQVHWPDGHGLGIAWSPMPQWLVAMDYSRMNWSKGSLDEYKYGHTYENIGFPSLAYGQKDSDTWKLGFEYRHPSDGRSQWILRAGYYRQEQMINQMGGMLGEQPIYKGYTMGAGFKLGKTNWDIAIMQLRGEEKAAWTVIGGDIVFVYDNSMRSRTTRILLSGTVLLD
jgi:hypothetical protein